MAAAAVAMIIANSPIAASYSHILHLIIGPELTPKLGPMTVHLWINDGLMAIFFLLVGLEIKREFVDGHLSTWPDRALPMVAAAAAGMIVPAIIYLAVAGGDPALQRGWAIPAATDIAFAIGVLALLGSRAPASLKLFLTTVAIVDDMGAVAIIALFYTAELNIDALTAAGGIWLVMMMLNRFRVNALWPYLILAALLWYATLLSGVHATIAGVMAAFAIPFRRTFAAPDAEDSTLHRLEHALVKPVAFLSYRSLALPMPACPWPASVLLRSLRRYLWVSRWACFWANSLAFLPASGLLLSWALLHVRHMQAGCKSMASLCCAALALR